MPLIMKRAILPALALALFLCVPAIPQGDELDLQKEVRLLKKHAAKQDEALRRMETYIATLKGEAATLGKQLRFADKKGFTYPAPNTDAREALLFGLTRFSDAAAGKDVSKSEK